MDSKKVLLVSLRSPFLENDRVYPPMGLLYLASVLKEAGHLVDLENAFDEKEQLVKNYWEYDAIGVMIVTPQAKQAKYVLNKLINDKDRKKGQILIAGGPHATFYTSKVEKDPWDYIVRGEGEKSIVNIIEGKVKDRVIYDFINQADFDSLPRPERIGQKDFVLKYIHTFGQPGKKATTFLTGRGCPMPCTFCEGARTPTRWTNIEKARQELDDIQELGFNALYVIDDLFTISLKKIKPYAEELKNRGIIYRCNGHAKFMTPEFADLLAKTGCVEIGIGVESGSQKILDTIQKRTTVAQNYNAIKLVTERGIRVRAFFMLGLPGETRETIVETEEFIANSSIDDFQLTVYAPYKGTQIRDEIDKGSKTLDLFIEGEPFAHTQKGGKGESKVRTTNLSAEEILKERDRLINTYKPASHTKSRTDTSYSETRIKNNHNHY